MTEIVLESFHTSTVFPYIRATCVGLTLMYGFLFSGQWAIANQLSAPAESFNDSTQSKKGPNLTSLNIRLSTRAIHPPDKVVHNHFTLPNVRAAQSMIAPSPQAAILEDDHRQRVAILTIDSYNQVTVHVLHDIDLQATIPSIVQCTEERQCAVDRRPMVGGLGCVAVCLPASLHAVSSTMKLSELLGQFAKQLTDEKDAAVSRHADVPIETMGAKHVGTAGTLYIYALAIPQTASLFEDVALTLVPPNNVDPTEGLILQRTPYELIVQTQDALGQAASDTTMVPDVSGFFETASQRLADMAAHPESYALGPAERLLPWLAPPATSRACRSTGKSFGCRSDNTMA